ncbi:PIG-L deacetylase family protein [Paramaledivibacter caminithermalis]|jgi:LmbE family N-acetylglucosaminyl deacetylase|uniref:GlcNAc-PI de-N-acetylase n=1 Tax=Paramaledivibacter caminithermalis (strain DSM 15212 / CIP 107654 / DViRD3) TaxID=1121301 RepID=A0A1M6MTK1_PARC5|nr:PIG-L deacetylase family protein [Paramaledivibacter caminithermalis]SHJ86794.1 GlcNAc-PI de-N-acetylase [Paramaledivibacter caminithermalis DSM 15212]
MLNLICFSPHPDDAELFVGGILLKHSSKYKIGIIDLTKGEKSTNGDVQQREKEALNSSEILGVHIKENLNIHDTCINHLSNEQLIKVVEIIRKYKPTIILAPYYVDKNPDHREAGLLIKDAIFKAALANLYPKYPVHRCANLFFILQVIK